MQISCPIVVELDDFDRTREMHVAHDYVQQ